MARVVQRRTPPYLLIVFVILFVTSTVLAVLFFNRYSDLQEQQTKLLAEQREVASKNDLDSGEVKKWRQDFRTRRPGDPEAKTVLRRLGEQVGELAYRITGVPSSSFDEAVVKSDLADKEIGAQIRRGLTVELTAAHQKIRGQDEQIDGLKKDMEKSTRDLADRNKAYGDLQTEMVTKLQQKDQDLAALDKKFQNLDAAYRDKLASAKKEYDGSVQQLNQQIAQQTTEIQNLDAQARKWKLEYEKLVASKTRPLLDKEQTVRRPDGKILRVLPSEGLAYIDIGSKDRVMEGLRLTVYPYTGIPDSGVGKGIVEVSNVRDDVSECRIIQQEKDNPIIPGDLVANIVYDSLRTYNFVVEGLFDPDNAGAVTPAGTKVLRDLIRRYGGNVVKDIGLQTNYLVLGEPPLRPKKPADTDPPEVHDLYQDRIKAFNHYQDVKRQAEAMQVPVLSGTRFLDMVGYMPARAARE